MQTWLKPNRRALLLGMLPPLLATVAGGALLAGLFGPPGPGSLAAGLALVAVGLLLLAGLARQLLQPRVGYAGGEVCFFLRGGAPVRVPLPVVEAFLLGQGPTGRGAAATEEAVNVVVRLAEKAEAWSRREVKSALGSWCDGYITIRGMWCEPLDEELLRRMNRQLASARREAAERAAVESGSAASPGRDAPKEVR